MPHTRAARLRALKEAAECGNIQQPSHSATNIGWNDYLGWDLPGLTYQPDASAWYPSEKMTIDQTLFFGDIETPTAAANSLPDIIFGPSSTTDFCGLQPWYSTLAQDLPSITPAIIDPPPCSGSEYTPYESTSLDEDNKPAHRRYNSQTRPLKIIRQTSSFSDEVCSQKSSKEPAIDFTEELDDAPILDSEVESDQVSNAKLDVSKKRKMAHSVIEKKYRSRITDEMTKLRHCVPSAARARSSFHSKHPKGQKAADDATSNHSSGKVATLSDAVQYVRALELQNEALHGQLDVMQRRNHTLEKIVLSKHEHSTNKAIS